MLQVAKLEKSSARQERVRRRESTGSMHTVRHHGNAHDAAANDDDGDDRPKKMRNPYGRAGKPAAARALEGQSRPTYQFAESGLADHLHELQLSRRGVKGDELSKINIDIDAIKEKLETIKMSYMKTAPGLSNKEFADKWGL